MAVPALLALGAHVQAQEVAAIEPSAIGEAARDLSFSPVARCRVLDTRVEGGRLSAGVPRHFDVADALSGQGGAADCLVPFGATVVLVRVAPVQPQGPGTLSTWAFGGASANGTAVKFNPSGRTARTVIPDVLLPICNPAAASCTHDITIRADGSDTDVIADVAGYFTAPAVPWSALSGKPAGFADDTDNDVLGGLPCANNQVAKRSGSTWICANDTDTNTTYTAGSGLTLTGTQFSPNLSVIQARVGTPCPANSAIRSIDAAGVPTCESDTDTNTTYTAGTGLTLTGTSFSVNTSTIQNRVAGICPSGIRRIFQDGTVSCGPTILSGRDIGPATCNLGVERITFSEPFELDPAVVLTPQGLSGATTVPPNTICSVGAIETTYFEYCCHGNVPDNMSWIAVRQ